MPQNSITHLQDIPYLFPTQQSSARIVITRNTLLNKSLNRKRKLISGLKSDCLSCHEDYHQQTLSSSCLNCHNPESFKPAAKFNHNSARFQLNGKHKTVDCLKCHKKEIINGKTFQEFRGVLFNNCTSCHKDPHQNQFGQNCRQCHTEESFNTVQKG